MVESGELPRTEMRDGRRRWALRRMCGLLLPLLLAAYALAFQGSRGLWEPDEGRYTAVALMMLETGDWLVPRLPPDILHFTKPPLTYWLIAGSIGLLGHHELAARLPGALAFAVTALLVGRIARRLRLAPPAVATSVYATMLFPAAASNIVTTDTLLTLWCTLAGYGFVSARTSSRPDTRRRFLLLMWLALGLGFLTKGPPALLPLLAFAVFVAVREGTGEVRRLGTPAGLAVFGLVGLGWFGAMVAARPELAAYFVRDEVVGRVFTGMHVRNSQWYGGFTAYAPVLVGALLPWLVLLRPAWTGGRSLRSPWAWVRHGEPERVLAWLWFAIPLAVLMMSSSRLPLYVLPLCAPLALLLSGAVQRSAPTRRIVAVALVGALATVGLRAGAALLVRDKDASRLATSIRAATGDQVEEVLLVDMPVGFGLAFYVDAEVEHVALEPATLDHHRQETLAEELAEHPARRAFVVDWRRRAALERELAGLGWAAEPSASLGRWLVLVETPSREAGSAPRPAASGAG